MTHPAPTINTTPLIDVLLVLLVLLIMTLPRSTHRIALDLPSGSASTTPPPITEVEVDFDGRVFWNGAPMTDDAQLEREFRALTGTLTLVRVTPDRHVHFERVAQILASAQRAHVVRLALSPVTD
jgi:biopolymer transport protein ExbD